MRPKNAASGRIKQHTGKKLSDLIVIRQKHAASVKKNAACGGKKPHGTKNNLGKKFMRPKNAASGRIKQHTGKQLSDLIFIRQKNAEAAEKRCVRQKNIDKTAASGRTLGESGNFFPQAVFYRFLAKVTFVFSLKMQKFPMRWCVR
jgi:hypothetical protein